MLEWILAAVWANYKPDEFFDLPGDMQSLILAAYAVNAQIESVVNYEQQRAAKAKSKR